MRYMALQQSLRIESNIMKKEVCEFTDPNIARKGKLLKSHLSKQPSKGTFPWFSMIEFNLCGLCNRRCVFCPRRDPTAFPNINKHMPVELYKKVMIDLQKINFNGTLLYSAFSEPLLHKHLEAIVRLSKHYCPEARVEIVTNGDMLTSEKLFKLFGAGLTTLCISMYDGPHQLKHFKPLKKKTGLGDRQLIFRKRWLPPQKHFGIMLSNRAGALEMKEIGVRELKEPLKKACYYPFYQILIDYDGAALLCAHDWNRRMIVGNVTDQSIFEIWNNGALKRVRMNLAKKNRNLSPCNLCDVEGTLIGGDHFDKWLKYYEKQQSIEK